MHVSKLTSWNLIAGYLFHFLLLVDNVLHSAFHWDWDDLKWFGRALALILNVHRYMYILICFITKPFELITVYPVQILGASSPVLTEDFSGFP
jgi:hypothetical protein